MCHRPVFGLSLHTAQDNSSSMRNQPTLGNKKDKPCPKWGDSLSVRMGFDWLRQVLISTLP
jgi:hypothetical protein